MNAAIEINGMVGQIINRKVGSTLARFVLKDRSNPFTLTNPRTQAVAMIRIERVRSKMSDATEARADIDLQADHSVLVIVQNGDGCGSVQIQNLKSRNEEEAKRIYSEQVAQFSAATK